MGWWKGGSYTPPQGVCSKAAWITTSPCREVERSLPGEGINPLHSFPHPASAMTSRTLDAVNKQIQAEFQSAYIYLAMSARFEDMKMSGAANWMRIQWQEETAHAMKLYDHLIRRGQTPVLQTIDAPSVTFDSALDAFEQVLAHEQHVTKLIHELYEVAIEEKDYALQTLLHWFIDEQVEEEENAEAIIDSLRLAGQSGQGLFLVDRELGQRAPEADEEA